MRFLRFAIVIPLHNVDRLLESDKILEGIECLNEAYPALRRDTRARKPGAFELLCVPLPISKDGSILLPYPSHLKTSMSFRSPRIHTGDSESLTGCGDTVHHPSRLVSGGAKRSQHQQKSLFRRRAVVALYKTTSSLVEKLRKKSASGNIWRKVITYILKGWLKKIKNPILKPYHQFRTRLSVGNGKVMRGRRGVTPSNLQDAILGEIYSSYFGIVKTKAATRARPWNGPSAEAAPPSPFYRIRSDFLGGAKIHYGQSVRPDGRGGSDSHELKIPEALRRSPLAHGLLNPRSVSGVRKLRERSLGAETVCGLGAQTAGSPEHIAGTDARGLAAAARLTLRGTPHTRTRAEPDTNAARRNTDTQ
ncbi:hypothetical protein EVAR_13801_1 [Eumeta japonica]|uniref:Uncharacterized protein n=1 Tax=Eumeta variegata TaxID=151549 RepID=A0A4C1U107_EUMVA|nr:hypothetical protein EVAR_13801_1 [Eumeta japonica]